MAQTLKRGFSYVLTGQLILACTNWLVTVMLAKIGSSVEVGIYSVAISLSVPIISLGQLMLRNVLITDRTDTFPFGIYVALRTACTGFCFAVVSVVALCGSYNYETKAAIILFAITPALDSLADIYQARVQRNGLMTFYGLSMAIRGLLNIAFFAVGYLLTKSLLAGLVGAALSSLVVLYRYDKLIALKVIQEDGLSPDTIQPVWHTEQMFSLAKKAFPLGVSASLSTLNGYLSRLFCVGYLSLAQIGIYSSINYLLNIGIQGTTAMGTTVLPKLTSAYQTGDSVTYHRILYKNLFINFSIGILGIVIVYFYGPFILRTLFTEEYSKHNDLLVMTMTAGLFMYLSQPFATAMTAMREFRSQVWASCTVVLSSVIFGLYLLPRYGLYGAALMTTLSMITRFLIWSGLYLALRSRWSNTSNV